jgi:peptidoglycan hydrolase-like protein with peptidoglycan-binding domain
MRKLCMMLVVSLLVMGPALGGAQQQGSQQQDQIAIREAQQQLKSLGLYDGPIDGLFGPKTEEALREYQQAQGLEVTGSLTQETEKRLMGEKAEQKGGQ